MEFIVLEGLEVYLTKTSSWFETHISISDLETVKPEDGDLVGWRKFSSREKRQGKGQSQSSSILRPELKYKRN